LAEADTDPSMICSLQYELRVEDALVNISLTSPVRVDGKGRLTVIRFERVGGRTVRVVVMNMEVGGTTKNLGMMRRREAELKS
jgi:hypothetical protein